MLYGALKFIPFKVKASLGFKFVPFKVNARLRLNDTFFSSLFKVKASLGSIDALKFFPV